MTILSHNNGFILTLGLMTGLLGWMICWACWGLGDCEEEDDEEEEEVDDADEDVMGGADEGRGGGD